MTLTRLQPAMESPGRPLWHGAIWISKLELEDLHPGDIHLVNSENYSQARLLIFKRGTPLIFLDFPVQDGVIKAEILEEKLTGLASAAVAPASETTTPLVSVVVCTRERLESLKQAVDSLLTMNYPNFEIIIVDNASRDRSSAQYVATLNDPRVKVIEEPKPGLTFARNTGLTQAQGSLVAFTDDDVVVDPGWLTAIVKKFEASPEVACVTGLAATGEIRTATQSFFEDKVRWTNSLVAQDFSIRKPPIDIPLFPFNVGLYGAGANFALRRSAAIAIGGFDEGLGVGSPTRGGDDIDMFVRIVLSGYELAYVPSAVVWHRHREDIPSLLKQMESYGRGLSAWLTKIAVNKSTASLAFRRIVPAVKHLRLLVLSNDGGQIATPGAIRRAQMYGVLAGPYSYWRSRLDNRQKTPLTKPGFEKNEE